jgi:hypothetical protein
MLDGVTITYAIQCGDVPIRVWRAGTSTALELGGKGVKLSSLEVDTLRELLSRVDFEARTESEKKS